ncbi:MAG: hypothetical protein EOT05_00260 [Candidatus Microsaccharimonas sossegonensis]|uniref:Uncharacterized protein n=1 Tax=Candidatus Microsaccharimonas sossegonensis TaxID=2506948 RepID=A0A4Q0AGC8_9BACT|nr:MAG: hypothetical protein EOT05_00260 [Candidatus Microsaccharimonas sossegonensis]
MTQSIKKITIVSSIPLLAVALVAVFLTLQANAVTTSVNSTVGSIISVFTSSGTVAVNVTPTAGGVQTIANDIITVSTNNSAGYTLKINETAGSTALVSGGNSIPATSGTFASPIVQTVNTWGYRVDGVGSFGAGPTSAVSNAAISGSIKFAAVPVTASPDTIKTTSSTATNDTTNVWYGVAVNTATPSGSYTNNVTYTAIAN